MDHRRAGGDDLCREQGTWASAAGRACGLRRKQRRKEAPTKADV
jgi:hypothetical protein